MTAYAYRPCCDAGKDRGVGYIVPIERPTQEGLENVDIACMEPSPPPPPVKLSTAMHEAAHALVLHALGYRIAEVQVGARNFVRRADGEGERMLDVEQIALALAGDMGGQLAERWLFYRAEDDELRESIARVKTGCHGKCDDCIAGVFALHVAQTGRAETPVAAMRSGEFRAYQIVSSDNGRRAVRVLGERLHHTQHMPGAEVHALLERFVPFGSYQEST